MSAHAKPQALTFKAAAAIAKGAGVTLDATGKIVTSSTSATATTIGVALNAATVINDKVEVALSGGGAKGLAGGTITAGDLVCTTTDGSLISTTSATNRILGVAMESAVAGDLFSMHVSVSII